MREIKDPKKGNQGIIDNQNIDVPKVSPISARFSNYRLLFTRIKKTKKTGNR